MESHVNISREAHKLKYKIAAFFAGRNGFDNLAKIIMWPSLIVMLVSGFIQISWLSSALYGLSFVGIIYAYFRCFSKNIEKRQAENNTYLSWRNLNKQRWNQRKTHKFYRCKKCKTVLRVPKGKGKISITCRTCGERFITKT